MATQVTNQASLTYNYGNSSGEALSNIAYTTLQGPLDVSKHSFEGSYSQNQELTYTVFVRNSSSAALSNVFVIDNLGTYELTNTTEVTPLTYVGPSQLFINDQFSADIIPTIAPDNSNIAYIIPSLPANSTAMILYRLQANSYAILTPDVGKITNTVSVSAVGITPAIKSEVTIPVSNYADVMIEKTMAPNPIMGGSTITYTFNIKNYGNTAATGVVLRDEFTRLPSGLNITVDGVAVAPADFEYDSGLLIFPAPLSTYDFTIPAATITQNATTGIVTVEPSERIVVVTGTL